MSLCASHILTFLFILVLWYCIQYILIIFTLFPFLFLIYLPNFVSHYFLFKPHKVQFIIPTYSQMYSLPWKCGPLSAAAVNCQYFLIYRWNIMPTHLLHSGIMSILFLYRACAHYHTNSLNSYIQLPLRLMVCLETSFCPQ